MRVKKLLIVMLIAVSMTSSLFGQDSLQTRELKVGLVMLNIGNVNNLNETIVAEFVVLLTWQDTSLVMDDQKGIRNAPLTDVNIPEIQFRDIRNLEAFRAKEVEIHPDGKITYRQRYSGTIKQKFDFREFPFDNQVAKITLYHSGAKPIRLVPDEVNRGFYNTEMLTIPEWEMKFREQEVMFLDEFDIPIQIFEIRFDITRRSGFYLWKVVVPLVLVVLMSWSVFWISPVNIGAQLTVSVTAILTLIVFQFSVAQQLPPLPYLTKLDKFIIGIDFLVFAAFIETIITSHLQDQGREVLSNRIDVLARYIFPVVFTAMTLLTLLL